MADDATVRFDAPLRSVRVIDTQVPAVGQAVGAAPADGEAMQRQAQAQLERETGEIARAKSALLAAADRLTELQAEVIRDSEQPLLDLAVGIARKVLMQEIQAGRHEIEPIVRQALSLVSGRRDVTVHLHPDDLARCELVGAGEDTQRDGTVRFVADPSVGRAECVVEGPEGFVASRIEAHLDEVSEALKSAE